MTAFIHNDLQLISMLHLIKSDILSKNTTPISQFTHTKRSVECCTMFNFKECQIFRSNESQYSTLNVKVVFKHSSKITLFFGIKV